MAFETALAEILERRTIRVIQSLSPLQQPVDRLPFLMTSAFLEIYPSVLSTGAMPLMLARKQVHLAAAQYNWEQDAEQHLSEIMRPSNNPIFDAWDDAWANLWGTYDPNRRGPSSTPLPNAKPKPAHKAKSKGLFGVVAKLLTEEAAVTEPSDAEPDTSSSARPVLEGLHDMMGHHAEHHGYVPPRDDDVSAIQDLVRVPATAVDKAWIELEQIHRQEFRPTNPTERARPGSLSEALTKWQYSLPPRIGEFLVLKAAIDLECCDSEYVKRYIRHSARSQEEGDKALPYLADYQRAMPTVLR